MRRYKIGLITVALALVITLFLAAKSITQDSGVYVDGRAVTTEAARDFVIRGHFILNLAFEQYQLDPTPHSEEALEVMTLQYLLILEELCVDPEIEYSCGEAYAFLDEVGVEIWGVDDNG